MSRHPHVPGTLTLLGRARTERRARRALEQELAGFATQAERDCLETLMAETGAADDQVVAILRGQAQAHGRHPQAGTAQGSRSECVVHATQPSRGPPGAAPSDRP